MMKRHIFWMLALVSSVAWANGSLKDAQGDVRINTQAAAMGSKIAAGSVVKTGPNSRATIRFEDGQLVVLGSNTEFKVREYAYSKAEPANDNIVFDIFRGTLRSISGALGKRNPNKFALYTPTATAGIRGTDFLTAVVDYVGQDGVTRQQASFAVKGGKIEVSTKAGKMVLGKGQAVVTSPSGAITPIPLESLPADLRALANMDITAMVGEAAPTSITGVGAGTGTAAVAVPLVGIAGAVAGLVAATSDNSTVTGHHGATSHHGGTSHHQ